MRETETERAEECQRVKQKERQRLWEDGKDRKWRETERERNIVVKAVELKKESKRK